MSGVPQPKQGTKPPAAKKPMKRTKIRAKPTTDRDAALKLHAKIVRAPGYCEIGPGGYGLPCSGVLNCCHIIRRTRSGTGTDLENAFLACTTHHSYLDLHSYDLIRFVDLTRGEGTYDRLQEQADAWTKNRGSSAVFWRGERARLQAIADEMGL